MKLYAIFWIDDDGNKTDLIGVYLTREDAEAAYADHVLTPCQHREMLQEFGKIVWGHCGYELQTITANEWYEKGVW